MLSQKLEEERLIFDEWWKNAGLSIAYGVYGTDAGEMAEEIAWEAWQAALEVKED
jgi:hypothetical protein